MSGPAHHEAKVLRSCGPKKVHKIEFSSCFGMPHIFWQTLRLRELELAAKGALFSPAVLSTRSGFLDLSLRSVDVITEDIQSPEFTTIARTVRVEFQFCRNGRWLGGLFDTGGHENFGARLVSRIRHELRAAHDILAQGASTVDSSTLAELVKERLGHTCSADPRKGGLAIDILNVALGPSDSGNLDPTAKSLRQMPRQVLDGGVGPLAYMYSGRFGAMHYRERRSCPDCGSPSGGYPPRL